MIELRPFPTLGHADHGWLDARHHFSFGNYYDPARMGWGAIRVWNDDTIAARSGFPPHPHSDMEIVTYVRAGAISHRDSLGNEGRTPAGEIQVMSAGRGITHAEFNLEDEETRLFQIWIEPRDAGGDARWEARPVPAGSKNGRWTVLASGYADDQANGALPIGSDARIASLSLAAGAQADWQLPAGHSAYLVATTGQIAVGTITAGPRDGIAISDEETISITASEATELVLVETARPG